MPYLESVSRNDVCHPLIERTSVDVIPWAHDAPPLSRCRLSQAFLPQYPVCADGDAARDAVFTHDLSERWQLRHVRIGLDQYLH
ncbi:hypothetical protein AS200_20495 [Streptomyces sp. CdTB01]|nr:hypothetical protein AS200_20495 [Streptomyces sp. CdTB01]